MGKLAITQNMTADGAVEMLGDWFDPSNGDPEQLAHLQRPSGGQDVLLLGRQTFEDFRGFWPLQTEDQTGITDELNTTQKYVVSSTMTDPQWQNSTVLGADWLDRVRELPAQVSGDVNVTGSIRLCHALIEAGVVDEVRLYVYPTVQGGGRRLFPDGFEIKQLRALETRTFANGVTYLSYALR